MDQKPADPFGGPGGVNSLSRMLHHLRYSGEEFGRGALGHALLPGQLLDGQDDLLYMLDGQLHGLAEVLLQHVVCSRLHHHWGRQTDGQTDTGHHAAREPHGH